MSVSEYSLQEHEDLETSDFSDSDDDEETPLLPYSSEMVESMRRRTPLPLLAIAITYFLQVCEPLTSQSIYPYINQLVRELDVTGGDERRVGYYAGLIESIFFATEAVCVLHWSRASDHVGRKPILLIGTFGSMTSMLCFGLSRTFWALVVSRALTGLLNGNTGVMKSIMGELTDSTNRAEAFAPMPLVWSLGSTLGPLIGGTLSRPHDNFPGVFRAQFWQEYPYFLPCAVTAGYVACAFLLTLTLFKENLQTIPKGHRRNASERPVPIRKLLTYPVIISISNYTALAFLGVMLNALLPLFLSTHRVYGGLGLSASLIGYLLAAYGASSGIFQIFFFAKIIRRLGEKRVFVAGISMFIPVFSLMPIISRLARTSESQDAFASSSQALSPVVWVLIAAMLTCLAFMDLAYGAIFMFITTASPNRASLGATNGLSQASVSTFRAVGPALASSLFSFTLEHNVLGGNFVYILMLSFAFLAIALSTRLPSHVWVEMDPESDTE
ncbi:MFS general substrate transporter [Fistulina hepatica ATCC 64428]|uniref:MFS general substrate transporter n=1 Tax=Fistulina hepatica ATCC 64428 TaxID=1128425 RepID=A0A0D7A584_9AGAR|nr:MFS general substrate transporter [Fistulina hepatica ATCC 64428]